MDRFYTDRLFDAVDRAFAEAGSSLGPAESATREKKRIRDKLRKAALSLDGKVGDGAGWAPHQVLDLLAPNALDRVWCAEKQYLDSIEWTDVFVALAADAWPRLGTEADLRVASDRAVRRWRLDWGRPAGGEAPVPLGQRSEDVERRCAEVKRHQSHVEAAANPPRAEALPTPQFCSPMPPAEKALPLPKLTVRPDTNAAPTSSERLPMPPPISTLEPTKVVTPPNADMPLMPSIGAAVSPPPAADSSPLPHVVEESNWPTAINFASMREISVKVDQFQEGVRLGLTLKGLRITRISHGSPCDGLLQLGDVITQVCGRHVTGPEAFRIEVERSRPGPLRLMVLRPSPAFLTNEQTLLARPKGDCQVLDQTIISKSENCSINDHRRVSVETSTPSQVKMIILNCEDIGRYGARFAYPEQHSFDWEAVKLAHTHYAERGFVLQCVCRKGTVARAPPPTDLAKQIVQCPDIDIEDRRAGRSADRLFVLRLAQTYDCPFVDNGQYRLPTWKHEEIFKWVSDRGEALKVEYIFDSFGHFVPLRKL